MSDELCFAPVAELARLVRTGETSAVALTEAFLERISRVDERLGAYLKVDSDGAIDTAKTIDAAIARGDEVGPLAGVPIALKDLLVTRGVETTAASKILKGWLPPYDGTVVSRLRAAGAILIGKTNLDEFAMGSSTENSALKPCRNPWDPERVPGGSSGGSGVAVAAGLCAGSIGTDTGGSIRQPAAFCGVVGLKPTYGRVSRYGVVAFASSLDQVGPFGRSVADTAHVLQAIAGFDPFDATSIDSPVPDYLTGLEDGVKGLRIGVPREYFEHELDPAVADSVAGGIAALVDAGAEKVDVSLPHSKYAIPAYYLIAPAEASSNLARYDGVRYGPRHPKDPSSLTEMYCRTRGELLGPEVKRRIMLGTFALRSGYYEAYYGKAQRARKLIRNDFDQAFENVDVIVAPTTPTPAFAIGDKITDPLAMYLNDIFTIGCNLAGLPGLSVPCGFTDAGLPVGMQMIGRALDESTILRAAAACERALRLNDRRPPEVQA